MLLCLTGPNEVNMRPGWDGGAHRKNLLLADARAALRRALARGPQTDPAVLFAYWLLMKGVSAAETKQIASAAMQSCGPADQIRARNSPLLGVAEVWHRANK